MDGAPARPRPHLTIGIALALLTAASVAPAAETPSVTFGRRPTPSGEQLDQTTEVGLTLKTQIRKQREVLEKQQSEVVRTRRRVLEPVLVEDGVTTAAYVRYLQSSARHNDSPPQTDPIAGKSYYCRRIGDAIQVLTRDGAEPPVEEKKLVAENMEPLGKPNPLADYLAGKTVSVGDKLALPVDVAQRLLGLGGTLGEVTKFELTLTTLAEQDGQPCAVFQADIEAQRTDGSQMRLLIGGPMTIEAATCRAVSSELSGPIGMSHSLNDPRGRLQLDSTGRVKVRVSSRPASEGAAR
ncbi:hypothetical protein Pla123a_36440 [Posidoniimonas polymericola]|uniref:Bacterial type II and III secretion system protein n=1 Tax=Posidoniimonas polymericola TaxID=2528002 RepID=A0A5C5YGQ3_9BACT|nr:hypothetical protein [Posidoniimonas polymericola]TWT73751.1 hypothetical protein Pla123a_36440 [Posidoniimonas polymericola]